MSGFTLKIILSFPVNKSTYPFTSGLGPTKLILPIKTLNIWGNSSKLYFLINFPNLVIRSCLNTPILLVENTCKYNQY